MDVIQDLKIRFSPQSAFNDPFDCISDTALLDNPQWSKGVIDNAADPLRFTGQEPMLVFPGQPSPMMKCSTVSTAPPAA
jgi:hypothetical protein